MLAYFSIIVIAIFVNNIVFAQFLGICPFLGVSSKLKDAIGMGMAVTAVMVIATLVTSLLWTGVLIPLNIQYMQTIVFILVIAALVQMLEIIMKKVAPALYVALGVFLPLITTNCAVLGVAILVTQGDMNLGQSIVYAFATAIGFTLALVIFAGIREQLELANVGKPMRGIPIGLIVAGILAMSFMGFSGIDPQAEKAEAKTEATTGATQKADECKVIEESVEPSDDQQDAELTAEDAAVAADNAEQNAAENAAIIDGEGK